MESPRDSGPSPNKDASGRKALPNVSEWHRSAPSAEDLCQNYRSQDEQDVFKRQGLKDAEEEATLEASKDLEDAGNHCQDSEGGAADTKQLYKNAQTRKINCARKSKSVTRFGETNQLRRQKNIENQRQNEHTLRAGMETARKV